MFFAGHLNNTKKNKDSNHMTFHIGKILPVLFDAIGGISKVNLKA